VPPFAAFPLDSADATETSAAVSAATATSAAIDMPKRRFVG
jgi:hypothetical protein